MLRFILAIPFLLHGLAHLSGLLASWTSIDTGYTGKPWLFSQSITLQSAVGRVFGLLWLAAASGFIGSALGIVFRQGWWPPIALVSAALSLVVIVPWWQTVPPGARFGGFFDLVVLVVLLSPLQRTLIQAIR